MVALFTAAEGKTTDIDRTWKCIEGCCAIAIKSCFGTESQYLHFLQKATEKPVLSVGPLLPDPSKQPPVDYKESYILRWLDNKPVASVVFVSFGSETFLSEEQIYQLAGGLEESHQSFLWVLRFPSYIDSRGDPQAGVRSSLPEGFENRTRDRGIVVAEWVPQPQIVSHRSVGCYVSHAGWSSVMEALMVGLPLILLPLKLDQSLNARYIVDELMVALEIERRSDGSITKDDICGAVRMVMRRKRVQSSDWRPRLFITE